MNELYKFNEYNEQKLNENLISDIFSKYKYEIKSVIEKKLNKLSEKDLNKLRKIFLPYKDLTFKEIQEKVKLKLETVKESDKYRNYIINEIDPYGEDEWDIEKDEKMHKKRRILKIILKKVSLIFGITTIYGYLLLIILLLIYLIIALISGENSKDFNAVGKIIEANGYITLISTAIFFICAYLYKRYALRM